MKILSTSMERVVDLFHQEFYREAYDQLHVLYNKADPETLQKPFYCVMLEYIARAVRSMMFLKDPPNGDLFFKINETVPSRLWHIIDDDCTRPAVLLLNAYALYRQQLVHVERTQIISIGESFFNDFTRNERLKTYKLLLLK